MPRFAPRKVLRAAVCTLFVAVSGLTSAEVSSGTSLEDLSSTVVYLMSPTAKRSGSGILIAHHWMWVVTAAHVARDLEENGTIAIRGERDVPISFDLQQVAGGSIDWSYHDTADLAVIRLNPDPATWQKFLHHAFPLDQVSPDDVAPDREVPLTMLGFPLSLGLTGRFSPLSNVAHASSGMLTLPRADTRKLCDFFLLDKPSIGGYSGAPVFRIAQPYAVGGVMAFPIPGSDSAKPRIVGIVHGSLSDDTGGKLAAITPSKYLAPFLRDLEKRANDTAARQTPVTE